MTGRRISLLCVLVLVGVGACDETGQRGAFIAHLFDIDVQCNEARDVCHDASNEQAKPAELLHGVAFVSHLASSDGSGTYLYLEMARSDGTIGVLEVDVPGAGAARVNYREIARGGHRETFKAHTVTGTIEVPPPKCRCDDGRFELQLLDSGPDQVAGTADDRTRRLSRGQFSRSGNYCRSSRLSRIAQVQGIRVIRLGCPTKRPVGGTYPGQTAYYSEPVEVGCGVEDDYEEDYDDGGCGGDDDYDDDYDDYDDSGCDGDGSDGDGGDDGSGGCEGDGSDDGSYDDSGDCAGGGCEDDANAAASTSRPRRIRPLGTLPYVLVALLITHSRRRRRRRDKIVSA